MPEARDRLAQEGDLMVVYSRRRRSIGSNSGGIEILADEPEEVTVARTPFRWGATAMTGTRMQMGAAAGSGGGGIRRTGGFGTPRNGRGRNLYGSPATPIGRENVFPGSGRGRARGRGSVLPYWYPRTPLRDITAVVKAIERTRARFGEVEGHSPLPRELAIFDPSASTFDAHLEHDDDPIITPKPRSRGKPFPLSVTKVPKILQDITNQDSEESGFLTPQKKLLNSIDTVEKVVMEELRKLKRTPTAKKAEREKRVRTLMSMR